MLILQNIELLLRLKHTLLLKIKQKQLNWNNILKLAQGKQFYAKEFFSQRSSMRSIVGFSQRSPNRAELATLSAVRPEAGGPPPEALRRAGRSCGTRIIIRMTIRPKAALRAVTIYRKNDQMLYRGRAKRFVERCPSWPKGHDWKSCVPSDRDRGFESHSLRHKTEGRASR